MTRPEFVHNVKGTQHNLRRFLTALCCGDTALADDLAQETYIKAYLRCGTLRAADSFAPWIYRIAYTTFLSHRRAQPEAPLSTDAVEQPSDSGSDSTYRYEDLYLALSRLSAAERTAVTLYYLEGYAIQEITQITGASTNAVKQQLSRGRSHLRNLLTPPQKTIV